MKEKRNCKVVEDLLPNYIEKLTNEETNKFVEEHLNECADCKKILENMKKEVELNTPKRNEKEVKYIKKFNKKFKILRNILLAILVIILIFVGNTFRKYSIIKNLDKKAEETAKSTNYHIKATKREGGTVDTFEYYEKDGNEAYVMKVYLNGNLQQLLGYKNKDNEKYHVYIESSEGKIADLKCGGIVPNLKLDYGELENMAPTGFGGFLACSRLKVKKAKTIYDGSKCYIIEEKTFMEDESKMWYTYRDMETGLRIKVSNGNYETTYEYEFDNVDDSIFIEPDISEYEIYEP